MVIVNPDHIPVLCFPGNGLSKEHVNFAVCKPGRLVEDYLSGMVMEQRP